MPPPAAARAPCSPRPPRAARPLLLLLAALCAEASSGCAVLDRPLLQLRSVAGGIHNRRRASGMRPFFLPDGRWGVAANGALWLEERPGGELARLLPQAAEVDDPAATRDGARILCVSGKDQITAGGGHNDHVWPVYALELASGGWTRLTASERAELTPRATPDGRAVLFLRRPEYDGWALDRSPWGRAALVRLELASGEEVFLSEPCFWPVRGLALTTDGARALVGAGNEAGGSDVWELALDGASAPRRFVADAAWPTPFADGTRLAFARAGAGGKSDVVVAPLERPAQGAPLGLSLEEVVGLAVAPDGQRLLVAELAPDEERFGLYRLWDVALEDGRAAPGATPTLVLTAPWRSEKRMKPLDVVRPIGWWFRMDARSPGSR